VAAIFDSGTGALTKAFAGDLKGNLWKFDLSDTDASGWGIEHGSGKPLFVARDDAGTRQPITGPLEIGKHSEGGYMVYFGTGKYFEKNDNTSTSLQTIYAIWDKTLVNDDISDASTNTPSGKANVLQKHVLLYELNNPLASTRITKIRVTDDVGAVAWSGGSAKRGWYMNLQVSGAGLTGERVVTTPILRNKRVIFTTLIPSTSPCEFGGASWIMEFDPMTGNRPSEAIFDLNGTDGYTSADFVTVSIGGVNVNVPASGVQSTEGIIKAPAIISAGGKDYKIGSGTTGNIAIIDEKGATNRPRASWRQVQ
jgi:type IV pilus assembly protein PilY1